MIDQMSSMRHDVNLNSEKVILAMCNTACYTSSNLFSHDPIVFYIKIFKVNCLMRLKIIITDSKSKADVGF